MVHSYGEIDGSGGDDSDTCEGLIRVGDNKTRTTAKRRKVATRPRRRRKADSAAVDNGWVVQQEKEMATERKQVRRQVETGTNDGIRRATTKVVGSCLELTNVKRTQQSTPKSNPPIISTRLPPSRQNNSPDFVSPHKSISIAIPPAPPSHSSLPSTVS